MSACTSASRRHSWLHRIDMTRTVFRDAIIGAVPKGSYGVYRCAVCGASKNGKPAGKLGGG